MLVEDPDGLISILTTSTNYKHATRAPGQSIMDARAVYSEFVSEQLTKSAMIQTKFWQQGNQGLSNDALTQFGIALHAITDSTSPAHMFFQEWDVLKFGQSIGHVLVENLFTGTSDATVPKVQDVFDTLFGQPFDQFRMLDLLPRLNDTLRPVREDVTVCIRVEGECLN